MKPIRRGELTDNISSVTVTFSNTGKTLDLKVKPNSVCHFFEEFSVGVNKIQLRLDWSKLDNNKYPMLDADFIDKQTGKHRSLKGKRKCAHHTAASGGKGRCYKWEFDGFSLPFSVKVVWLANGSDGIRFSDIASAEVISSKLRT